MAMIQMGSVWVPAPLCYECRAPLTETQYWRTDLGPVHVPYCAPCHDRLVAAEEVEREGEVPR